jgi:hypothetical protein
LSASAAAALEAQRFALSYCDEVHGERTVASYSSRRVLVESELVLVESESLGWHAASAASVYLL